MKNFVGVLLVGICIGAGSMGFLAYKFYKPSPIIQIKEVIKPVYTTLKEVQPNDTKGLYECYQSPIFIKRELKEDIYYIEASDGCKKTAVADKIEVGSSGNWKLYIGVGAVGTCVGGYLAYKILK